MYIYICCVRVCVCACVRACVRLTIPVGRCIGHCAKRECTCAHKCNPFWRSGLCASRPTGIEPK